MTRPKNSSYIFVVRTMIRVLTDRIQGQQAMSKSRILWGSDEIKKQYPVLQNRLVNVPFCGPLVKAVCGQMLAEGLVDLLEVQQYIDSPNENGREDMRKIVLMFVNR